MADIEKVITGLELCTAISQDGCLMLCPYKDEVDETYPGFCQEVLKQDVLTLLKEQESIIETLKSDLQETLDVVANRENVVRCKDCKKKGNSYLCRLDRDIEEHGGHRTDAHDDWFCADGVWKDGEQDA